MARSARGVITVPVWHVLQPERFISTPQDRRMRHRSRRPGGTLGAGNIRSKPAAQSTRTIRRVSALLPCPLPGARVDASDPEHARFQAEQAVPDAPDRPSRPRIRRYQTTKKGDKLIFSTVSTALRRKCRFPTPTGHSTSLIGNQIHTISCICRTIQFARIRGIINRILTKILCTFLYRPLGNWKLETCAKDHYASPTLGQYGKRS